MFFELIYHFGRRGREGLRLLTPAVLVLCVDDNGREYFEKGHNEWDKNHRSNVKQNQDAGVISARPGDPNCPVLHIKRYLDLWNK